MKDPLKNNIEESCEGSRFLRHWSNILSLLLYSCHWPFKYKAAALSLKRMSTSNEKFEYGVFRVKDLGMFLTCKEHLLQVATMTIIIIVIYFNFRLNHSFLGG